MTFGMFASAFSRHWFERDAVAIWEDRAQLQAWLDVEAALALTQSELGLIPAEAGPLIAAQARSDRFDLERIAADTAATMHPFVPVLRQLEALCGPAAAGYVHWGATTQNIFDTAAALLLKRSHAMLEDAVDAGLDAAAALARAHRDTLQAGRTHGQHALPITFGFKVAGWHAEWRRHRERLAAAEGCFTAAMGGAVGSFAAMAGRGRAVQDGVARRLGLAPVDMPMRPSFDRGATYAGLLGGLAGTAERVARDVTLLQRNEIAEVAEAFHHGKVGSSTMAQKRNPQLALNLVALAAMQRARVPLALEAMVRADEGDSAASNIGDVVLPEMAVLGISIARGIARLLAGITVDAAAMRRNLDLTRGAIMAEAVMMQLAARLGRHHAHALLYDATIEAADGGEPLAAVLQRRASLATPEAAAALREALDPARYLGEAGSCIDAELERPRPPHARRRDGAR
jgi:adenylosuccinate lyase/3-carboxy-cis,cis-muconate cycloisomerase